jgi:hypothetical protein
MSSFNSITCKFGFHKWSKWRYAREVDEHSYNCKFVRVCKRCQKKQERDDKKNTHEWGTWKPAGETCMEQRFCKYCQARVTREAHSWGHWKDAGIESQRQCSRCGQTETKEIEERIIDNIRYYTKRCYTCGKELDQINMSRSVLTIGNAPTLYEGVVCNSCGRLSCSYCQGEPLDRPCRFCGGTVSPAYVNLVEKIGSKKFGIYYAPGDSRFK